MLKLLENSKAGFVVFAGYFFFPIVRLSLSCTTF
jgi:hypothetical protein